MEIFYNNPQHQKIIVQINSKSQINISFDYFLKILKYFVTEIKNFVLEFNKFLIILISI